MIELLEVTRRYPGHGTALEAVSLRFEQGEFAFITGPSGAGKSTLLKLIYAAERPTLGDVQIEDRSVARLHPRSVPYLRRNMGIVFQDFKLLARRSAAANVALALEVVGVPRAEIGPRVNAALQRVGLEGMEKRLPGELSGGEQQRIAIARAIVNKPSILLADEPTGNLDRALAHEIVDLLVRLCREDGTTVLLATHDAEEIARWPFRVVVLEDGRLLEDHAPRGEAAPVVDEPPAAVPAVASIVAPAPAVAAAPPAVAPAPPVAPARPESDEAIEVRVRGAAPPPEVQPEAPTARVEAPPEPRSKAKKKKGKKNKKSKKADRAANPDDGPPTQDLDEPAAPGASAPDATDLPDAGLPPDDAEASS